MEHAPPPSEITAPSDPHSGSDYRRGPARRASGARPTPSMRAVTSPWFSDDLVGNGVAPW